jgi:hypothetical protein
MEIFQNYFETVAPGDRDAPHVGPPRRRAPKPVADTAAAMERIQNFVKSGALDEIKGAPVGESGGPKQ